MFVDSNVCQISFSLNLIKEYNYFIFSLAILKEVILEGNAQSHSILQTFGALSR